MELKPSNIFYSQDTIGDTFGRATKHNNEKIGDTLDSLCRRPYNIKDIPTITVVKKDGKWFTQDNRRLWIFHHLEAAGKCDRIPVKVGTEISSGKFTTKNGGVSVTIYRGQDPGGRQHRYITPVRPTPVEGEDSESNSDGQIEDKEGSSETGGTTETITKIDPVNENKEGSSENGGTTETFTKVDPVNENREGSSENGGTTETIPKVNQANENKDVSSENGDMTETIMKVDQVNEIGEGSCENGDMTETIMKVGKVNVNNEGSSENGETHKDAVKVVKAADATLPETPDVSEKRGIKRSAEQALHDNGCEAVEERKSLKYN